VRRVLVDTSVWVDHFRRHNDALADLLGLDRVMMHPMVLGELACGTPPSRSRTLADLGRLDRRLAELASRFGVLHRPSAAP
jgi:predicted nucleic acid-binding protein